MEGVHPSHCRRLKTNAALCMNRVHTLLRAGRCTLILTAPCGPAAPGSDHHPGSAPCFWQQQGGRLWEPQLCGLPVLTMLPGPPVPRLCHPSQAEPASCLAKGSSRRHPSAAPPMPGCPCRQEMAGLQPLHAAMARASLRRPVASPLFVEPQGGGVPMRRSFSAGILGPSPTSPAPDAGA